MRRISASWRPLAGAACAAVLTAGLALTGVAAGPAATASAAPASAAADASSGSTVPGYWMVASDGGVYAFNTTNFGGMRGTHLNQPVVGGAATPDGLGYWMVASDGGIFTYGNAPFYGSTGAVHLWKPIVGMAADPATGGYWLVASDGGVFSFNAPFYGSTGGVALNQPIVGMAATPTGNGYWLVAADGGVFSFGDAKFYGSTGDVHLWKPIVGMAATPTGHGYWLAASDGGVFTFGDADFHGSTGGVHLVAPVKSIQSTASGNGYWLAATDGGVFTFGDAAYLGSAAGDGSPAPIVAMMSTASGFPFPPGSTGYDISYPQCGNSYPPASAVSVVGVAKGRMDGPANPCYQSEAAWAGTNISAYMDTDPLPSPAPSQSLSGPAGTCNGNVVCQSYNYGWYWAVNWVHYSRTLGINPTLWWLDIEPKEGWSTAPSAYPSNNGVIAGALAGLRAEGVQAGIYSTSLQWGEFTGNQMSFPGIPLWVPGATTLTNDPQSASAVCTGTVKDHVPFAGGKIVLVQYGYVNGPPAVFDPDYACPAS